MKNKIKIRLAFMSLMMTFLLTAGSVNAQELNEFNKNRRHIVSVSLVGHTFSYSLNYERVLSIRPKSFTTLQVGVSYLPKFYTARKITMFPVTANHSFKIKGSEHLEIGAGGMLVNSQGTSSLENGAKSGVVPIVRVGYRMQNIAKRVGPRVGFTPILGGKGNTVYLGELALTYKL